MATPRLPQKKDVALALLETSSLFIHLDPRREGVVVPVWFKKQPQLVLQVGLNMAVPIPDLNVDDDGITCTLSFNRSPHYCSIPWRGIYALIGEDSRGMVWPDDVPAEVAAQQQQRAKEEAAQQAATEARSKLRAVPGGAEAASAEAPVAEAAPPPKKARGRKAASGEAAPAAKKPRTKKATPVSPAPATPAPVASKKRAAKRAAVAAEPPPEPVAATAPASGGKRPLPPYLRVVK